MPNLRLYSALLAIVVLVSLHPIPAAAEPIGPQHDEVPGHRPGQEYTFDAEPAAAPCAESLPALTAQLYPATARDRPSPYDQLVLPEMPVRLPRVDDFPGETQPRILLWPEGSGYYLGVSGRVEPWAGGGEIGIFQYDDWLSMHAGLSFIASSQIEEVFGGLILGVRANAPSRLSPFVGAGLFVGQDHFDFWWEKKNVLVHVEIGDEERDWFASIYPELGIHFWINHRLRLTTSVSYNITTDGPDSDFWWYGVSLGHLVR